MNRRVDVCVIGSANLDLVATARRIPAPGETVMGSGYSEHAGGKGLNQAVAAARSGAHTRFIGAVGDDEAGRRLLSVLSHDQVDATVEIIDDEPTGRAIIVVDEDGENSIVVVPGANSWVGPEPMDISATVVLAQLEIPIASVSHAFARARADGAITVLNPAPAAPLPPVLLADCDYVVPNEHEVELLGGTDALLDAGCRAVIVTRGAAGVDVVTASGTTHVDPVAVEVVDTTGAGDAFCGGLCSRLAAGDELLDAVRWASVAGALATTVAGAVPAQPSAAAIREVLMG